MLSSESANNFILGPPTPEKLGKRLEAFAYHVLVYLGHGGLDTSEQNGACLIYLEGEDHYSRQLPGEDLADLLQTFPVPVVLLAGCLTAAGPALEGSLGVAQLLVRRPSGVRCAIGMRNRLEDADATEFLRAFFNHLLNRTGEYPGHVEEAVRAGRLALRNHSKQPSAWSAPALFSNVLPEPVFPFLRPATAKDRTEGGVPVVPRLLTAFGPEDKEFFLDLLPGPRDKQIPTAITFWLSRINALVEDEAFPVGVLHGPTGSGKSSFLKAGLLPRLGAHVRCVVCDCRMEGTERLLVRRLREEHFLSSEDASLPEFFARLAAGGSLPAGHKVLVVLDQFEQWLSSSTAFAETSELVKALQHCDGVRLQCLLAVRTDFWPSLDRLFRVLPPCELSTKRNFQQLEPFQEDHAARVLEQFGRAFGPPCLPRVDELSPEQKQFLADAARQLARGGVVLPVWLSFFAYLLRAQPWVPRTLRGVGGPEGLVRQYLDERFPRPRAAAGRLAEPDPRAKRHQIAQVLGSLLPPTGAIVLGEPRPKSELAQAAQLPIDSPQFRNTLLALEEIKFITPTKPETSTDSPGKDAMTPYFNLSHDSLVSPIRDWVERERAETWQGWASLVLERRSADWAAQRRDWRRLPWPWECLLIVALTSWKQWRPEQGRMMRRAFLANALLLAIGLTLSLGIWWLADRAEDERVRGIVGRLVESDAPQIPSAIRELEPYRRRATPLLRRVVDDPTHDFRQLELVEDGRRKASLRARLALLPAEPEQADALCEDLFSATAAEFDVLIEALKPARDRLQPRLWDELHQAQQQPQRAFRAGLTLAAYNPNADPWSESDINFLVEQLFKAGSENQQQLRHHLRGMALGRCKEALRRAIAPSFTDDPMRERAASALADLFEYDPVLLAEFIPDATPEQFTILKGGIFAPDRREVSEHIVAGLSKVARARPSPQLRDADRVALGKRRMNAAAMLLTEGLNATEAAFEAFRGPDDPEAVSQFIHGARAAGVTPQQLIDALPVSEKLPQDPNDPRFVERVRYTLMLTLGGYEKDQVRDEDRQELLKRLLMQYQQDPSSAVHSAAAWLIRRWGTGEQIEQANKVDDTPLDYDPKREWFVLDTGKGRCMTFIVFQPAQFKLRVPGTSEDKAVEISAPFALADRELTIKHIQAFADSLDHVPHFAVYVNGDQHRGYSPGPDHPAVPSPLMDLFGAQSSAQKAHQVVLDYCNWLTDQAKITVQGRRVQWRWEPCYPQKERRRQILLEQSGFRLPTEAEWFYACQGGLRSAYGFGSDRQLLADYAWYVDSAPESGGFALPQPVARLRPNLRGLFDMHGNEAELCHFSHIPSAGKFRLEDEDRKKGEAGLFYRGGCFNLSAGECRALARLGPMTLASPLQMGFRLALTLGPALAPPAKAQATLKELPWSAERVAGFAFSHDGQSVISITPDGTMSLRRLSDGQVVREFKITINEVTSFALSPDGATVAAGDSQGKVRLANLAEGKLLHTFDAHDGRVVALAFSPDSKTVASAGRYKNPFHDPSRFGHPWQVELWDVVTGKRGSGFGWVDGNISCLAFHPKGGTLACGAFLQDRNTRLLDESAALIYRLGDRSLFLKVSGGSREDSVQALAFHPDGDILAIGRRSPFFRLHQISERRDLDFLHGPWSVAGVTFSPDGSLLAAVGPEDRDAFSKSALYLWRMSNQERLATLTIGSGSFEQVAFSRDGSIIASRSASSRLRLWKIELPKKDKP
jgi:formylglycine-generating enzyme required for sulfatase activity